MIGHTITLREALDMAPHNMNILFCAGTAYKTLGEREKALYFIGRIMRSGYSRSDLLPQPGQRFCTRGISDDDTYLVIVIFTCIGKFNTPRTSSVD
jgi:hypothetical protein